MPKTIFSKLLFTYIMILLISALISIAVLDVFLSNFLSDEKVKLLQQTGDRIDSFLSFYVDNGAGELLKATVNNVIRNYSENTDSVIWVATTEGEIVFVSQNTLPQTVTKKLTQDGLNFRLPEKDQYKDIAKEDGTIDTGDFYGLFKETGVSWVTVIRPFYYYDAFGGKKLMGAVYLSTQLPELKNAHLGLLRYFIIAVSFSGLIAVILIYIVSLRISRPITDIKNAAKGIASGRFENRIQPVSNDEIGELATSFNEMAIALKNLEDARRTFIANVSHELRTPMTSIAGFVDGMIDGTIPMEKHNEYLKIVSDETGRLTRLANDILELAKVESGEISLNFSKFGINELIRRCIIKMEGYFNAKNLQINTKMGEEIFVNADLDCIERVLTNLLHNSAKFTNEKGSITVETYLTKGKIYISVEDTGVGIPKAERELIWDRFYKSDKSRSEDKGGAGLGLAIVLNIIKRHEQEIWVDSNDDEVGVKFTFTLEEAI